MVSRELVNCGCVCYRHWPIQVCAPLVMAGLIQKTINEQMLSALFVWLSALTSMYGVLVGYVLCQWLWETYIKRKWLRSMSETNIVGSDWGRHNVIHAVYMIWVCSKWSAFSFVSIYNNTIFWPLPVHIIYIYTYIKVSMYCPLWETGELLMSKLCKIISTVV